MTSIREGAFPGSEKQPVAGEWRQGFQIKLDVRMRPRRVYDPGFFVHGRVLRTFGAEERIVEVELHDGRSAFLIHSYVIPPPV